MRWLIPHSRAGMVWRFLAAALVIVGASASATAVAGLLQVQTIVNYFSVNPGVSVKQVTLPNPGAPQTLLLIGSDHRYGSPFSQANTDTILLVRLNAASATINVMSIPRDLEVTVPGQINNPQKINAAYSEGGYGLLIQTIKANVFPSLHVNHIIDTNFTGFSDLVDAIGCVYSDVDHRYYNNSNSGIPGDNYSSIDIEPGYQKLCGNNQSVHGALPFVRFRHTDTDLVREARQQDFIRWAKDQYPVSKLLANRDKLLRIFGNHSTTDSNLHSVDGLIELFDLVLNADGSTIKQIPFPADLQPCTAQSCFVTASSSQAEQQRFDEFMDATPKTQAATAKSTPASAKGHKRLNSLSSAGLTADMPDGRSQVAQLPKVQMPIYFPKLIVDNSQYCLSIQLVQSCYDGAEPQSEYAHSYPREYQIPDQHGHEHAAYRMTLVLNSMLGEYYGVQGVAWRNPPLLASPSGTRTVNGRQLLLYADGGRLTTVAWRDGPYSYWISNTLTSTIPNREMVAIAASLVRGRG